MRLLPIAFLFSTITLCAAIGAAGACGGVVEANAGGAGGNTSTSASSSSKSSSHGPSSVTVTTSSSDTTSSSSSSSSGAGGAPPDAGDDGPCTHCNDFLVATTVDGGDPIAVTKDFCMTGGIGDPFGRLASWVSCGCAQGGVCWNVCQGSAFCTGLTPFVVSWTPPDATCAACMNKTGIFMGCGDEKNNCAKDK